MLRYPLDQPCERCRRAGSGPGLRSWNDVVVTTDSGGEEGHGGKATGFVNQVKRATGPLGRRGTQPGLRTERFLGQARDARSGHAATGPREADGQPMLLGSGQDDPGMVNSRLAGQHPRRGWDQLMLYWLKEQTSQVSE